MVPKTKKIYLETAVPELKKRHAYTNPAQVPALSKIVINISVGTAHERDALQAVTEDLAKITGQKPLGTKAKKSVSNFKLREGLPLGAKVTLRGTRMWEFMDRLINIAFPRIRDFRGISVKSFDGCGNYSLGLSEQTIFPEINPDRVKKVHGMDVTFVTTAETDAEALDLLKLLGMPFVKETPKS
jgi:large subunit ribosomal protein L5